MTDTKKRTLPEIQQEYQNLCLKAGHLQYQVSVFSGDLDMVNKELRSLNFEAAALKAEDEKASAKAVEEGAKTAAAEFAPSPAVEASPATLAQARSKRQKNTAQKEAVK